MPSHKTQKIAPSPSKALAKLSKPQTKKKAKKPSYSIARDETLTSLQASTSSFRRQVVDDLVAGKAVTKGAFRYASNPTLRGFSSGYHEAFVVTDMTDKLARRTKAGKFSRMPKEKSGIWAKHSQAKFSESQLKPMLIAGDMARTDTARTILSAPGGEAAGHSGSGVKTTGQGPAHDLLRKHSMSALQGGSLSQKGWEVQSGAMTIYSMAPGMLGSQAHNASKLKDQAARDDWEDRRNESKLRLHAEFKKLAQDEQDTIMGNIKPYAKDISASGERLTSLDAPASPLRSTKRPKASNALQGGAYESGKKARLTAEPQEWLGASSKPGETAAYITQPFRTPRRKFK